MVVSDNLPAVDQQSGTFVAGKNELINTILRQIEKAIDGQADIIHLPTVQDFSIRLEAIAFPDLRSERRQCRPVRELAPGAAVIFHEGTGLFFDGKFAFGPGRGDAGIGAEEELLVIRESVAVGVVGCEGRRVAEVSVFPLEVGLLLCREFRQNLNGRAAAGFGSRHAHRRHRVAVGSVFRHQARDSGERRSRRGSDRRIAAADLEVVKDESLLLEPFLTSKYT